MNSKNILKGKTVPRKTFLVFFVTIFCILASDLGFAQVATYSFGQTVSTYTTLASASTAYAAPWDDHVSGSAFLAPLGFNFAYNGINQSQCYISPNGYISFGVQPASTNYFPLSIATPFTNGGAISALGMDLISGSPTENIVYQTIGSAPNRIFAVQWANVRRKVSAGIFNFQIRLYESTNQIEISYGSCGTSDATVYNAQVGIRGVSNDYIQGEVNNRLQNGTNTNFPWFGKTVAGAANSSTVRTV